MAGTASLLPDETRTTRSTPARSQCREQPGTISHRLELERGSRAGFPVIGITCQRHVPPTQIEVEMPTDVAHAGFALVTEVSPLGTAVVATVESEVRRELTGSGRFHARTHTMRGRVLAHQGVFAVGAEGGSARVGHHGDLYRIDVREGMAQAGAA